MPPLEAATSSAEPPASPVFNIGPNLTEKERAAMLAMLHRNINSFAPLATAPPPPTLGVSHAINLTDAAPIKTHPYKQSPLKNVYINEEVRKLLANGLIVPSNSPWSSAVVIVPKADGSLRMCIDYRKVNAQTKKDAYPMPLIEDCLNMCKGAKFLSIVDVQDAYHHILMEPDSRAITAFVTNEGLFEWHVMPFGLSNAPATFQRHVDTILRPHIGKTCAAFFDDIVVFTNGTFEQHLIDTEQILAVLAKSRLSAKIKKCKFGHVEINFVGHIVRNGVIMPDPEKVRAVTDWPAPTTVPQLQAFIGLVNYYRRFIKDFSIISGSLYALLKKDEPWQWGTHEQGAFEKLKTALLSAPCLHGPDYTQPFILQTDASIHGLGAVLTQLIDGEEHPIMYLSRQLNAAEKNYAAVEWEMLAAVWAIRKCEYLLIDSHFTLVTDASSLKALPSKKFANARLMRWAISLNEFSFTVRHRSGKNNANADSLSRAPLANSAPADETFVMPRLVNCAIRQEAFEGTPVFSFIVNAVTRTRPAGESVATGEEPVAAEPAEVVGSKALQKAKDRLESQYHLVDTGRMTTLAIAQHADAVLLTLINYITRKEYPVTFDVAQRRKLFFESTRYAMLSTTEPHGLYYIFRTNRNAVQNVMPLTPRFVVPSRYYPALLAMYHDSPFGGHLSALRTYRKLSVCYYWTTMLRTCEEYVNKCDTCRAVKQRLNEPKTVAGTMPVPTEPFEVMSVDTCGPFEPSAGGFRYIFTFVDHFSRWAIAIPSFKNNAASFSQVLLNEVVAKYGTPRVLISDAGSEFVNSVLNAVYRMLKTRRIVSSPYHPQSNGLVERMNGTLKQVINTLTHANKDDWAYMLPFVAHAINTSHSEFLDMTPWEVVFGRAPHDTLYDAHQLLGSAGDAPLLEHNRALKNTLGQVYSLVEAMYRQHRLKVDTSNAALGDHPVYREGDIVYRRTRPNERTKDRWNTAIVFAIHARRGDSTYEIKKFNIETKVPFGRTYQVHTHDICRRNSVSPAIAPADDPVTQLQPTPMDIAAPTATSNVGDSSVPRLPSGNNRFRHRPSDTSKPAPSKATAPHHPTTDGVGARVHAAASERERIDMREAPQDPAMLDYQAIYSLPLRGSRKDKQDDMDLDE